MFSWRIGDQEQARTMADHFAASAVLTLERLAAIL